MNVTWANNINLLVNTVEVSVVTEDEVALGQVSGVLCSVQTLDDHVAFAVRGVDLQDFTPTILQAFTQLLRHAICPGVCTHTATFPLHGHVHYSPALMFQGHCSFTCWVNQTPNRKSDHEPQWRQKEKWNILPPQTKHPIQKMQFHQWQNKIFKYYTMFEILYLNCIFLLLLWWLHSC